MFCSCRDLSEEKIVENFLEEEGVEESKKAKILQIIKRMGKFCRVVDVEVILALPVLMDTRLLLEHSYFQLSVHSDE